MVGMFVRSARTEGAAMEVVNESFNWAYEAFQKASADPYVITTETGRIWADCGEDGEYDADIRRRVDLGRPFLVRAWHQHHRIFHAFLALENAGFNGQYDTINTLAQGITSALQEYGRIVDEQNASIPARDAALDYPHFTDLFNASRSRVGLTRSLRDLSESVERAQRTKESDYCWQPIVIDAPDYVLSLLGKEERPGIDWTTIDRPPSAYERNLQIVKKGLERFGVALERTV